MNNFTWYFQSSRFFYYLRYLSIFYLKRTIIPFLYSGLAYILYAFLYGIMDWSFPNYTLIHMIVNLLFLIILINMTSTIFSPLHQPHSSLQELGIPISTEERFWGNFFFYGGVMLGSVYIIHTSGLGIMTLLSQGNDSMVSQHLKGEYTGVNLSSLAIIYIYFFAGSIYFRKSSIPKSLIILTIVWLMLSFYFEPPNVSFDVNTSFDFYLKDGFSNQFSLKNSSKELGTEDGTEESLFPAKKIIQYLFFGGWFIGGYFKLRRSQFRA